jgi:hypothetical protein
MDKNIGTAIDELQTLHNIQIWASSHAGQSGDPGVQRI